MELKGNLFIKANRENVFAAIRDPNAVVGCIEGVGELEAIDDSHFRASMQTRVGFMRLNFKIDVELLEVVPHERVRLQIQGRSIGLVGRLRATSEVTLSDGHGDSDSDGDDGTMLNYLTELVFTGKLGSIGQAAIKAKASELEKQFATNLSDALNS